MLGGIGRIPNPHNGLCKSVVPLLEWSSSRQGADCTVDPRLSPTRVTVKVKVKVKRQTRRRLGRFLLDSHHLCPFSPTTLRQLHHLPQSLRPISRSHRLPQPTYSTVLLHPLRHTFSTPTPALLSRLHLQTLPIGPSLPPREHLKQERSSLVPDPLHPFGRFTQCQN